MLYTVLASPLPLPRRFKEDLILKKIHHNRDSVNIQGDPIPLASSPIHLSWKLKQLRWHHRTSTPTTVLLSISRLFWFSLSHLLIKEQKYSLHLLVSSPLCEEKLNVDFVVGGIQLPPEEPQGYQRNNQSLLIKANREFSGVCRSQQFTSPARQHFEANRS